MYAVKLLNCMKHPVKIGYTKEGDIFLIPGSG